MRALREIILAFGLLCFIEGALYALFPDGMKRMMAMLQGQQPDRLRTVGLIAAAAGVALMWLAR
jgi:uncharacterized protein YjeT (DUF2065 family)